MSQPKFMLSHDAFSLLGTPPITAMAAAGPSGAKIAVINGKLVKIDAIVNPQVAITGATKAKPGELVALEAKLSNHAPQYLKTAKIKWTVTEKGRDKVCWTDGKKVIFGTGVESTTINVNAALSLGYQLVSGTVEAPISEIVKLTCEATTIIHIGNLPAPDPNNTTVSQQVKTWAVSLVDSDTRTKSAHPLAQSFKTISQGIGTGDLADLRNVLRQSKSTNNEALIASGVDPRKWDGWGSNLQDMLYNKYIGGGLKSVDDIKNTWYEISNGLYYSKG